MIRLLVLLVRQITINRLGTTQHLSNMHWTILELNEWLVLVYGKCNLVIQHTCFGSWVDSILSMQSKLRANKTAAWRQLLLNCSKFTCVIKCSCLYSRKDWKLTALWCGWHTIVNVDRLVAIPSDDRVPYHTIKSVFINKQRDKKKIHFSIILIQSR